MKIFITEQQYQIMTEDEDFDPVGHYLSPQEDMEQADEISDENPMDCLLTFTSPSGKHGSPAFDLLAGYSCPFAGTCLSKATREYDEEGNVMKRALKFGDYTELMCYAARDENRYDHVYDKHFRNFELLTKKGKNTIGIYNLLLKSFNYWGMGMFDEFRIHNSGDFFNQYYFDAWMQLVQEYPSIQFRAYTKSMPFVLNYLERNKKLPANMCLTMSYGSAKDDLIPQISKIYGIPSAKVLKNLEDAKNNKLPIDIDDTFAKMCDTDFGLLAHGIMRKGSQYAPHRIANDRTIKLLKYAKRMPDLARELAPILKKAQDGELVGNVLAKELKKLIDKYIKRK